MMPREQQVNLVGNSGLLVPHHRVDFKIVQEKVFGILEHLLKNNSPGTLQPKHQI
jgi:hypothetical protein